MWFLFGLLLGWSVLANGRLAGPLFPDLLKFRPADRAAFKLLILLVATLLCLIIAWATDRGSLSTGFLTIRSFFLTKHVEAFVIGFVLGAFINLNRRRLMRGLRSAFSKPKQAGNVSPETDDANKKSSGLQIPLVLVAMALILIAVRPEIFAYVRSFKFAGVEATFSEGSAAVIKEADLHLEDLREALTLEEYKDFYRDYINSKSSRGLARTLFGPKRLEDESGPIAELLMIGYFRPVIASIVCLNEMHELGSAPHNAHLASFVYALAHMLFNIHSTGTLSDDVNPSKKEDLNDRKQRIKEALTRLRNSGLGVARQVQEVATSCIAKDEGPWKGPRLNPPLQKYNVTLTAFLAGHSVMNEKEINEKEIAEDVDFIDMRYQKAIDILKEKGNAKPPIISLMVMDAYLVGATADLIALLSGQQKDKAIFLTNLLDQFPHSDEFITPGIINIFYQLSDARVRTLSSWSLQQTLTDLDHSLHGSNVMLSRSAEWLNARRELQPPEKRCSKDPDESSEENLSAEEMKLRQEKMEIRGVWCIHDTYLRNTIIGLTTKLQLFNAMELSNRPISAALRQEWRSGLGKMMTLLKTRLDAAIVVPPSIPAVQLDARKAALLPTLSNTPHDMLVDADLAAALSLVLIDGRENPPNALACNLALYLLNDADRNAAATNEDRGGQPKDAARETRWRQLVSVHSQQIGRSCGWSDVNHKVTSNKGNASTQ